MTIQKILENTEKEFAERIFYASKENYSQREVLSFLLEHNKFLLSEIKFLLGTDSDSIHCIDQKVLEEIQYKVLTQQNPLKTALEICGLLGYYIPFPKIGCKNCADSGYVVERGQGEYDPDLTIPCPWCTEYRGEGVYAKKS